jgi:hypothetical protein
VPVSLPAREDTFLHSNLSTHCIEIITTVSFFLSAFRVERSTSFDKAKLFDNALNQSSLGERDSSSISVSGDGNAEDIFDGAVFERKREHTELEHIQYEIVLFLWYSTFKGNATVHGNHGGTQLNESPRHRRRPLTISGTSEEHQETWRLISR